VTATAQACIVEQTAACETGQHYRCADPMISLTAAHGAPCGCPCHGSNDLAVTAIKRERDWLGNH
jgi:hypothetical protein